ncbi:MAG TPA: phosphoribosylanthranilate isomerase [Nevskiales bacterium]|nr:phosphoribosylanthranilate isomerase [Nevskiales bacterium]
MPTRIKICGITRRDDAWQAAAAGAHAIGLMFYRKSPRYLPVDQAVSIRRALPPFMAAVAVFMDAEAAEVRAVAQQLRPDLLQFHGREPADFCAAFGLPYLKTIPMGGVEPAAYAAQYPTAAGFLLDSHAPGAAGGSGRAFDWTRVPAGLSAPLILAGGLTPDNVAEAVRRVRPYAVDVSSGVESSPGIKDAGLMQAFVKGVQRGDLE